MKNKRAIVKERLKAIPNGNHINDPTSADSRANRLKRVRNLANLSREQMCDAGGINIHTLIGWENSRFGGLSRSGASRVIERIAKEGVHCTVEWLLNEIGRGPSIMTDFTKAKVDMEKENIPILEINEEKLIIKELLFFRSQNANAIDFIIQDDGMFPPYNIGDYIAGNKRYKDKIKSVIGLDCIAQTDKGEIFFRNVRHGPDDNTYNLVCNNPHTKIKNSIIYAARLVSAAPIIWHRRKDPK